MLKKLKYWIKRDSHRKHCRSFCVSCPYFEVCKEDEGI